MLTTGAPAHNWAGNVTFGAARVHRPAALDELRKIVAGAARVRALGTGHSFNRVADTDGDLVRVDGLPRRVEIDAERSAVTVGAGLRYAEVAAELHAAGFALANLASLPHISVAGSVATGTHGSGDGRRGLASAVSALELVGPEGDLVTLSRDADPGRFPGAVVSLGALGVVTALTLDVEPAFEVAQWVYNGVPLDTVAERFDEVTGAAYSVSTFTDWHGGLGTVWLKRRTDVDGTGPPGPGWLGGTAADALWHPIPGMPAEFCTEQLGVPGPWHERLPHFRPGFTPSRGEELQSELFLPRAAAPAAFAALREVGAAFAPVLQVSEIRTIAADEQWLSPAYGRDTVAVHFTWIKDTEAVLPVLAAVEERLLPLGARPHWGKLTTAAPATVAARYERLPDFRDLVRELDPAGRFRNDFAAGLLGD
ncbi:FAD-binding protein [Streptomyces litchfieldiae]|uniref:FAD-binding protein n=1 Tax=Streptomyces litchfieldiae TaxID=3075543 RepID=A0ABU2MXX9_9ACTN|nr:FAD-binding protein [Streptomyces sp. DSM 44938]MDT0345884.1 FAD-binding protein [Streptomyces sp. DSM 44938]